MKDDSPEQALENSLDSLNAARFKLVTLVLALTNDYTSKEELADIAGDALKAIDTCIGLEAMASLARQELAKRVINGELTKNEIDMGNFCLTSPGAEDTIN